MADDDTPTAADLEAQRRASAQGAAGDLARMGIDPRLLGLDTPAASPPRPHRVDEPDERAVPSVEASARASAAADAGGPPQTGDSPEPSPGGRIVPLRPEFAPGAPAAPAQTWARPGVETPARSYGPVEQLLARTAAQRPAPAATGHWLKTLTRGLVTPDAAESANNERVLVAALRTRQTGRRVIAFCAGKGGVGTTTVAMGVGSALAALREDKTVLVDAQAGTPPLSGMLGGAAAPTARELAAAAVRTGPMGTVSGLWLVDGSGWGTPLRRADVGALLDRLKVDHAFVLVDVGNDAGEAGHAVLARSDQTAIVTGAGHWGLAAARVASDRLHQIDPHAALRAVHVVVCTHDESHRRVRREVADELSRGPVRVVVVPPDPLLAAGQAFDAGSLRPATREAMLEVAAALAVSGSGLR